MPRRDAIVCRQAVELVTDYLEGALTPERRARFDDHVQACRNCAAYLSQVRTMLRAVARLAAPEVDRQVRDELIERYRRWTAA